MKQGIMKVFHYYFHEHVVFEKSINATFIALIPKKKKSGALEIKDFWP